MLKELADELSELGISVRGFGAAVYAANEEGGGGICSCSSSSSCSWG